MESQSAVTQTLYSQLLEDPARFALYKLVVAQERGASFQKKVEKDIAQASEVVEALVVTGRRDDLDLALMALLALPYGSPKASLQNRPSECAGWQSKPCWRCLLVSL